MKRRTKDSLDLGPDVIQILLPHRRPLLMVDRVVSYSRQPRPTLLAWRHVSANEEVFAGHFPGLHLWPGVYTIEGMGQTCQLLYVLGQLQRQREEQGGDAEDILVALRNLEAGYRQEPGFQPELAETMMEQMPDPSAFMGFSTAVDVKLLRPVFAGQRLEYRVTETHVMDDFLRWEVEARAEGQDVARGKMSAKVGIALPAVWRKNP